MQAANRRCKRPLRATSVTGTLVGHTGRTGRHTGRTAPPGCVRSWGVIACGAEWTLCVGVRSSAFCAEMVEAGGIEPPSRDISARASTCVVHLLSVTDKLSPVASANSGEQDFASATSAKFLALRLPRNGFGPACWQSPVAVSQARPRRRGCLCSHAQIGIRTY